jgi:hypothetical protein
MPAAPLYFSPVVLEYRKPGAPAEAIFGFFDHGLYVSIGSNGGVGQIKEYRRIL